MIQYEIFGKLSRWAILHADSGDNTRKIVINAQDTSKEYICPYENGTINVEIEINDCSECIVSADAEFGFSDFEVIPRRELK